MDLHSDRTTSLPSASNCLQPDHLLLRPIEIGLAAAIVLCRSPQTSARAMVTSDLHSSHMAILINAMARHCRRNSAFRCCLSTDFTNDCRLVPTALQGPTITAIDLQYRHLHEATIFLPEDMISIEPLRNGGFAAEPPMLQNAYWMPTFSVTAARPSAQNSICSMSIGSSSSDAAAKRRQTRAGSSRAARGRPRSVPGSYLKQGHDCA